MTAQLQVKRPDLEQELRHLKDFQRLSVDAVFRRLYLDRNPTRHFLVADEVGLGKTLVARGVIARTIDHLWDRVPRIDIIYLCSNSDIARQNVRRLTPFGISGVSLATRITLLPIEANNFKSRKVNVVALTPGTSLSLKGSLGLKLERALLQHMLEPHWNLPRTGTSRLFAGPASLQRFKTMVHYFKHEHDVDEDLRAGFLTAIDQYCKEEESRGVKTLKQRFLSLVDVFATDTRVGATTIRERNAIVGEIRHILAKSCIQALQPDLIVLDEFQRFKEILDGEGPAGEMATELFRYEDSSTEARVLLLSATPYKMYTVQDDAGAEDHYVDFLRTATFLFAANRNRADELGALLKRYRHELFRVGQYEHGELVTLRAKIESILREVMIRTERLAVTEDRNGMLVERPVAKLTIQSEDALNYGRLQTLARVVQHSDTMEYWKAAPWLLNFMDTYKFKTDIDSLIDEPRQSAEFLKALRRAIPALLDFDSVKAFRKVDPGHARIRWLVDHMLDNGLWRVLWLPPTHPYYELASPFSDVAQSSPTKALLFSAWRVVPRVVAAALSYEAERRMYVALEGEERDLSDALKRLENSLPVSRKAGRVSGLSILTLLYPSTWMARVCDPLRLAIPGSQLPTLDSVLAAVEQRISPMLARITATTPSRATPDESWYWAAPILLDREAAGDRDAWFDRDLVALWSGDTSRKRQRLQEEEEEEEEEVRATPIGDEVDAVIDDPSAFHDVVSRVRSVAAGEVPAGMPPRDLLRVLALMAISGPATVALRSFSRVAGVSAMESDVARDAAARIGASFRTLFGQPDATAIVRATAKISGTTDDYWKECLQYSANGCLQSTLDEYAHLLVGEAGVFGKPPDEIVEAVTSYIADVVGIKRASVGAYDVRMASPNKVASTGTSMRSRFAMRFGEERADESGEKVRSDEVRKAFNSPFWPFLLATTSVGQEGLDFHQYCHRVIHWNLPPNPVDLEQREGRVHRFKGHAVRKNVAKRHADIWLKANGGDPWEAAFDEAKRGRIVGENDLVPYWVYPAPDGAAIERYVPAYPLSRDVERFRILRESLAVYRMVFGQPRQEELLAYLTRTVPVDQIQALAAQLMISLAPRSEEFSTMNHRDG